MFRLCAYRRRSRIIFDSYTHKNKGINTMGEFEDRVALITGAGRGIGRALAVALASQGAVIAANDITPVNLDETMALVTAPGGRIKDYLFDVAKRLPTQAMVDQVLEDWDRIDLLINCAGVYSFAPLLDMDEWDWQRTLDVNLSGPFYTMQQVGRAMREQGGGAIVNLGSAAIGACGMKDRAAFIASKAGLIALTREAAREFAPYHIRVNAVCPGEIERGETHPGSISVRDLTAIPMGRRGREDEVVSLILFLCSDAASYLTGQAIGVDGGLVMC